MTRRLPGVSLGLLLASTSVFALASTAQAQAQAAAPAAPEAAENVEQIVVTGSRISQLGYQAPTPVTVAPAAELLKGSPTSIPDGLVKLPQFVGSFGPARQSNVFGRPERGNVLNLRGIGPTRTLILLDGVRAAPTTYVNTVDVNVFPSLLIQRVDVVTAGASSVYGSDAVSGVVNFVLDSRLNGVKGVVQGGVTSRGDGENMRLGLAGGRSFAGGRGHVVASVDFNVQNDYPTSARPKLNDRGLAVGATGVGPAGSANNPLVQQAEVRANFATFGGLATSGPFANTNFISPGLYAPVNRGTPTGTPAFFVAPSDYIGQGRYLSASAFNRNTTGFAKASYDFTDQVTGYVQLLAAKSENASQTFGNLLFGAQAAPIFSGNPFIPAPLQAQLTATNTASFNVARLYDDLGPIRTYEDINNVQFTSGLRGQGGRFDWRLDYSYGNSEFKFRQPNQFDLRKLAAALDAVVDPATNRTVCRPSLSADPGVRALYANCVPFNTLGIGAASLDAANYVMGVSQYTAINITNDVVGSVSGRLFTLPAGDVSAVVGAEYRTASLNLKSNSDPGVPVNIAGLRGLPASTVPFYLTNVASARGDQNVKEAFGELAVPLLKDAALADSLDLNGAVRATDYSTSGTVWTWKVGGTWAPTDGLRFRAARSRDIRAPTLFDLFAGPQFTQAAVLDPHTGIAGGFNQITSGNARLEPEIGRTFTAGVVIQPRALSGFSLSVDYFDLRIKGAITSLTPLAILQDCEASGGTAASCANVSRPLPFSDRSPANYPTQVTVSGINAALIQTRGIDIDASYRRNMAGGQMTARLYATRLNSFRTQLAQGQLLIDYAGYNAGGSGGVTGGLPKWKGNLSLNYERGPLTVFVQENYVGPLKLGPVLIYRDQKIASFYTTDVTVTYRLQALGANTQLFGTVTNLFDKTPPLVYGTGVPGAGLSTIVSLYDITGRAFVAGARFNF